MKIGIVSFHREPNYGTMLQACALAQALRQCGVAAEYIHYSPWPKPPCWKRMAKQLAARLGRREKGEFAFFQSRPFRPTLRAFQHFLARHIPVSGTHYYADTVQRALHCYDRFLVGSDQTWSPLLNKPPYSPFTLSFVPEGSRRLAYAPSLGTTSPSPSYLEWLAAETREFAALSCRERTNCHLLSQATGREVTCVLDPTLLLTSTQWDTLARPSSLRPRSYVLAYILGEKPQPVAFAERVGAAMGLPVYYLPTRPCHLHHAHLLDAVGPDTFLGLIRDAACVVTDSFHGTVFSINYEVPFYSFTKRSGEQTDNDRILEVLSQLGLASRFREDADTTLSPPIDYAPLRHQLESLRASSWHYLRSCLQ